MIEAIENFFSNLFGGNVILATILIAMIPIIEVKGAIPFAMSHAIWQGSELVSGQAFLWAIVGSTIVVPLLILLYVPIIRVLKKTKLFRKIATKIEDKINSKKQTVENKIDASEENKTKNKAIIYKVLGVFMFVAIPLPFTGVWTGSCLAVALGLGFALSCVVVIVGNIIAGLLVLAFSSILSPLVFAIIFFGLVIVFALFMIVKKLIKNKKEKVEESNNIKED